jgi:hypothetical protein
MRIELPTDAGYIWKRGTAAEAMAEAMAEAAAGAGSGPRDLFPTTLAVAPNSFLVQVPDDSSSTEDGSSSTEDGSIGTGTSSGTDEGLIFESRESLAYLDFQIALQASGGFFGNAWSSFSVELLARHQQRQRQRQQNGDGGRDTCQEGTGVGGCDGESPAEVPAPLGFYNPWIERDGRGEWGIVVAPPA